MISPSWYHLSSAAAQPGPRRGAQTALTGGPRTRLLPLTGLRRADSQATFDPEHSRGACSQWRPLSAWGRTDLLFLLDVVVL